MNKASGGGAGGFALGLSGSVTAGGPPSLAEEFFLGRTPVPRKTQVVVVNGHKVVGRGDDVLLEAYAKAWSRRAAGSKS